MSQFLLKSKREALGKAFEQGLGMSRGDQRFIAFTERNPGKKALIALTLSFVVAAVVFALLRDDEKASGLVFRIFVFGLLLTFCTASVFLISLMMKTAFLRLERAAEVAKCAGSSKSLKECDERVRMSKNKS